MTESTINQPKIQSLELRHIVKRFPGVLANDHVSFDVKAGEVHALLGENGAGKSTLMKILYGLYHPDEGQILINGQEQQFKSPRDAIAAGIGMVHQHFMLVPTLTVTENVALGLPSSRGILTDLDKVAARIRELSAVYGLQVHPEAYVWQLAVGEQQRVEIIKALYRGASLLVLDEPTAVLTPQEVDELFVTFREMVERGHALIFISHKLHEIIDISQRVTVMRDGRVVGSRPTYGATRRELAEMMVGRPILLSYDREVVPVGEARLQVRDLYAMSDRGTPALRGVSLDVHSGEILGLAGVSGNGQRELAEVIGGLRAATGGQVLLNGQDSTNWGPSQLMQNGQAYIPEERMRDGAIKDFSVTENAILQDHPYPPFSRNTLLNFQAIKEHSERLIKSFKVKTPSGNTPIKNLSGGNIQKLILARELSRNPRVLIAAQPTRGVDIGAAEYIHKQLLAQRTQGLATLLISEDLDEIRALSDRIAVMFDGHIMGIVNAAQTTAEELGLMMAGEGASE